MPTGQDTLRTRAILHVGDKNFAYYSIKEAEKALGDVSLLPVSLKILLEGVLRFEDGTSYTVADAHKIAAWLNTGSSTDEVPFKPARILMQDFTGVPAVVDLAAMRDGILKLNGDPQRVNPLVPVDLVIDHSVMVDFSGTADSLQKNVEVEFERNGERYAFLRWGQEAFQNFRVVPPGAGICHQVNLGVYQPGGLDVRRGRRDLGLSGHAVRDRQPHDHGQRRRRAGLGRGRHRGGGGDAGTADRHADPRRCGVPADWAPAGRGDRHRPCADGDADASPEGRGGQVRRVFRAGAGSSERGRSGDDRQHGARIRGDLRLLPRGRQDSRLSTADRP